MVARYRDIAQDLKTRIAAGEFAPGDQLPSIASLMQHYKVPGLNTIRQAQQLLVDDGLLETRQGVGSFVLRAARSPHWTKPYWIKPYWTMRTLRRPLHWTPNSSA